MSSVGGSSVGGSSVGGSSVGVSSVGVSSVGVSSVGVSSVGVSSVGVSSVGGSARNDSPRSSPRRKAGSCSSIRSPAKSSFSPSSFCFVIRIGKASATALNTKAASGTDSIVCQKGTVRVCSCSVNLSALAWSNGQYLIDT